MYVTTIWQLGLRKRSYSRTSRAEVTLPPFLGGACLVDHETLLSDTSDTLGFETEKNSELGFEVEVVGQIEGRMGRGLAGLEAELDLRWAALGLFFKKSSTFDAYSELCIFFVFL